ncbi:hypothetical protein QJS10_CPB22g00354 [Acorus calamus]|uniref:Methylcrotonoyl-CoA carboxylase subunit alpha, mitochondrial n=1 Tax=Acorus calamus TaxID=4465 RepID=A0AAV9C3Q6_ACOCL|nr:hypothetical protein QJS10_CPB22g00354 [Acorus calamus]
MSLMASLIRRRSPTRSISQNPNLLLSLLNFSSSPPRAREGGGHGGIQKILVANRGEIACRVIRTSRRLGIRTVAVYSDADRGALHVKSADEAVRIGPPPARLSYLNASAIVEAALRNGAQAIHPGYGFLSESAEFANFVKLRGLYLLGLQHLRSVRWVTKAGVPLVPGYHGDIQDINLLKEEAGKIGYPIIIKPTHGGGGKGMRIVQGPDEFIQSLLGAKREAAASFGIDTVLLEKYITKPRHIEVQVFGDKHGNVLRDCSVQRRHQKIIEEAPAPHVKHEFRSHLGEAAVSAAKVEHPVTEMIVGQDLVEWQIRVANGEPLPLIQSQVPLTGHAFEARIYAENVPRGFLPATGVLHHYRPVPLSSSVRVETGVGEGDTVSMHYDPMIAKLVVWGENRDAALIKLKDCLLKFQVEGLPTNINFLQRLANHWAFEDGLVETHFIEQYKYDLFTDSNDDKVAQEGQRDATLSAAYVAACLCKKEQIDQQKSVSGRDGLLSLWYADPPFRMHHCARRTIELDWDKESDGHDSELLKLSVTYNSNGSYFIEMSDNESPGMEVEVIDLENHNFRVHTDWLSTDVSLAVYVKDRGTHIHVWHGKHHHRFKQMVRLGQSSEDVSQHKSSFEAMSHPRGTVVAPMAGLVIKVLVENGSKVEDGQPILVLEAMKMEHVVKAPFSGYVHGLQIAAGQQAFDSNVLFRVQLGKLVCHECSCSKHLPKPHSWDQKLNAYPSFRTAAWKDKGKLT